MSCMSSRLARSRVVGRTLSRWFWIASTKRTVHSRNYKTPNVEYSLRPTFLPLA